MKEVIRGRARELGFDDCRFTTAARPDFGEQFQEWLEEGFHGSMEYLERNAEKRRDPEKVLGGARSVITLAVSYYGEEERKAGERQGVAARYARYSDYHKVIGERLEQLAEFINGLTEVPARSLWYVDTGPILERDFAQRAGLGFIGKHTNLINRKLGNWIFLSEIITTLELEPDDSEKNRCGKCTKCIEACPTAAIKGPFRLDARLCISYLTIELKGSIPEELRPAIGNRIFGCDDCLAVCPWNRFAKEGQMMKEHARQELGRQDLVELLSLDEAHFKKRFAGTPIVRAKRSGLLRNVCVALGNVGDETVLPELRKAAEDADAVIAEHARWATGKIEGRRRTG
jgi:epoxyqueuosine reductase